MVDEKFPDLKVAWKATDDFGNYHTCRNGEAFGLKRFEAETWGDNGEDRDFDNAFDAAAYLNEFISKTDADFDKFTPEEVELQKGTSALSLRTKQGRTSQTTPSLVVS